MPCARCAGFVLQTLNLHQHVSRDRDQPLPTKGKGRVEKWRDEWLAAADAVTCDSSTAMVRSGAGLPVQKRPRSPPPGLNYRCFRRRPS